MSDRAEHISEILAVPYIQRRVECGYYKFTPQQIATAKTIEAIEEVQGGWVVSVWVYSEQTELSDGSGEWTHL